MRELEVNCSRRVAKPVLIMSREQPGYLDLPSDTLDRLISNESIEKYYEVEDQPFARGKFAAVRKCTHRTSGKTYAAKFLRKRRRSTELRGEILHEVAVLEACSGCPRVVRLHHVFESEAEMILLLELAPGGELQMLLDQDEVPEEHHVARLMRQILDGVCYLHSINVAHLDIKPQNLVLTGEYPECDVKLCDFGISRYISHGADIREILGTPDYVAPEVLNYESISLATDMWSVGVLVYVLLTGCSPFGGDTKQETFCNISQCKLDFPDDLFEEISEEAKDLISKLLVKDPSKRLSATECLEHVWFSSQAASAASSSSSSTPPVVITTPARVSPAVPVAAPRVLPTPNTRATAPVVPRVTPVVPRVTPVVPRPPIRVTPPIVKPVPAMVATSITKVTTCVSELVRSPTPITEVSQPVPKTSSNVPSIKTTTTTPAHSPLVPRRGGSAKCVQTSVKSQPPVVPLSVPPPLPSTPPPLPSTPPPSLLSVKKNGIVTDRKSLFKKNMESLVQLIDEVPTVTPKSVKINNDNCVTKLSTSTVKIDNVTKVDNVNLNNNTITVTQAARVVKATATHTMPASYRHQFGPSNLYTAVIQGNSVPRRTEEPVYKFRRCYVEDEDHSSATLPHRMYQVYSSGPSSTGSDSPYEHSSDTSSDTVSEMSIDSSSDRSSIISLDDSLDLAFSKRFYADGWEIGTFNERLFRQQLVQQARNSSSSNVRSKVWPKECNGSFARAFSLFSEDPKSKETSRQQISKGRWKPANSKSVTTNCTLSSASKDIRKRSVELMREENGNLVVIREVENGKYSRFNEVKCESLQSRIRKLQVKS